MIFYRMSPGSINKCLGRSIGVLAKKRAPEGYIDLNSDDYSEDDFIYPFEQMALNLNL
jgi:hypothetical protein